MADGVEELRREAARLKQALGGARLAMRGELRTTDPGSLVTLHLAEDLTLVRVEVARRWTEVGLEDLVTPLNQAAAQAQLQLTQRWADDIDRTRAGAPAPAREDPPRPAASAGRRPAGDDQLRTVLGRLREQVGTAQRMRREGAPQGEPVGPAEVRGSSENGRLTVVLQGEDVIRIETNEHWLRSQSPLQVGTLLREAVLDVLDERRRLVEEAPRNEYQELADAFGRTAEAARELGRRRGIR